MNLTLTVQQFVSINGYANHCRVCDLKVVKLLISFLAAKIRAYMIR